MSILSFPNMPPPLAGDTYLGDNGITYVFDGRKWIGANQNISGGGGPGYQGATGLTGATGASGANGANGIIVISRGVARRSSARMVLF